MDEDIETALALRVGIAMILPGVTADELQARADAAMYEAKRAAGQR